MKVLKATRLAGNPRRVNAKPRTKRKMSPKQIRIFGTKRQKAALRASRARPAHRPRTKSNPLVVTLKPKATARNPHRRRTTVAVKRAVARNRRRVKVSNRRRRVATNRRRPNTRHRRRSNPRPVMVARRRRRTNVHHRRHNRHRNPTRIVVMAPRRANRRHRNPDLFGAGLGSKQTLKMLGGGLVGVAAAKFIPQLLPASLTSSLGTSAFTQMLITGASAVAAGWLAGKLDKDFGNGVMFGGLMQTASVGLNAFLPNFTIAGVPVALGDLVQGQFAVPQNPLRQMGQRAIAAPAGSAPSNMPAAAGMKVTSSGLGRAYPAAY